MATSVTGIGSLNYTGVGATNPPQTTYANRIPTSNDSQNFTLLTIWLANLGSTQEIWQLVSLAEGLATWIQLYPGAGGGATQFVTDSGTANEAGGVLNVLGGIGISTTGTGNTVTISGSGDVATSFPTDSGTATPSAGALTVHGGSNINTSGSLSTVTVDLDDNVFIGASLTLPVDPGVLQASNSGLVSGSRGTNGELLIGNTGINPTWNTLSSTDSSVSITNGAGTINLEVSGSHAASIVTQSGTATPVSGVLNVDGTNLLTTSGSGNTVDVTLTNGSDGQIIIGGGASPAWANLTSDDMSIVITTGANSIDLSAVGGGGGGGNFESAFSAYQATNTGIVFPVIVNPTPYPLGSNVALTVITNVSNALFPGDGAGAPATFTAPVTGTYFFHMHARRGAMGVSNGGITVAIVTPSGNFQSNLSISTPGATRWLEDSCACTVPLNANDQVTFTALGSSGSSGGGFIAGSGSPYVTYIGGFMIKSGSTAGQVFQAVQTADATNVTGSTTPTTYLLGSSVVMSANFDPNGNFFPGDGIGTPCNYTAPATGFYQFNYKTVITNSATPNQVPPTITIITPATTYESYTFTVQSPSWSNQGLVGNTVSVLANLTSGDVVTFGVLQQATAGNTCTVKALNTGGSPATMISGFRVG